MNDQNEFPKALYLKGDPSAPVVFVDDAAAEKDALERGYKMIKDASLPEPSSGNGISADPNATPIKQEDIEGQDGVESLHTASEQGEIFLGRPIDEIRKDLPLLTDEELQQYRSQEVTGKNRSTLLTAFDAEAADRAEKGA